MPSIGKGIIAPYHETPTPQPRVPAYLPSITKRMIYTVLNISEIIPFVIIPILGIFTRRRIGNVDGSPDGLPDVRDSSHRVGTRHAWYEATDKRPNNKQEAEQDMFAWTSGESLQHCGHDRSFHVLIPKHRLHHKGCPYALESQLIITSSSRALLAKRSSHLLTTQQTCHSMTKRIRLYHSQVRMMPLRKPASMYHILNCLHELPRDVYRERRITLDRSEEH